MFERYTEPARRTIFYARYEALQFGSGEIGTQHILLGIHREARALVDGLLRLTPGSSLRIEIERLYPPESPIEIKDIPLSLASCRSLAYAAREADLQSSAAITPEHLMLGLLAEKDDFIRHLFPQPEIIATNLRKTLPRGHHWHLRFSRWVNPFSIGLFWLLALLSLQVVAKSMTHTLPRTEFIPYGAAIALSFSGAFALTTLARGQLRIGAASARRRKIALTVMAALATLYLAAAILR